MPTQILPTLLFLGYIWGQTEIQSAQKLIQRLQKVYSTHPLTSHARLQSTVWVPDSMWNDTTLNNGASWDEDELTTYVYYSNAMLEHDSLFSKSGSNWTPQTTTRYYYTTNLADSLQLRYSHDGTAWSPTDSITFTYVSLAGGIRSNAD